MPSSVIEMRSIGAIVCPWSVFRVCIPVSRKPLTRVLVNQFPDFRLFLSLCIYLIPAFPSSASPVPCYQFFLAPVLTAVYLRQASPHRPVLISYPDSYDRAHSRSPLPLLPPQQPLFRILRAPRHRSGFEPLCNPTESDPRFSYFGSKGCTVKILNPLPLIVQPFQLSLFFNCAPPSQLRFPPATITACVPPLPTSHC